MDDEVAWGTERVIFRDGEGEEHLFGLPETTGPGENIFTFIATYARTGRDPKGRYTVMDKLER